MKIVDFEQGTPEWLEARAGKVTASRIADVPAKIKSGEAAARRDYRAQLVAEILTGRPQEDGYQSPDMLWGTEQEPLARSAYELARGVLVDMVGFVLHPTIDRAGASPDGVVSADEQGLGLVEIKCPNTATHIQTLLGGTIPGKYRLQMLWQMACTGRQWCDFVSYDPRMPEDMRLFVQRLARDDAQIADIADEVKAFLVEVDETVAQLTALYRRQAAE